MKRTPRMIMKFLSLVALLLLGGCGSGASTDAPPPPRAGRLDGKPPIILITIDTLRRDHLGTHGYFRDTSPRLDSFAEESLVFEGAVASMASTLPSHLSMLTGLYAHQHGIEENSMVVEEAFQPTERCRPVAMFLREEGYATGAFVSSWVVGTSTGIDVGFETFDVPTRDTRRGHITNQRALAWLDEHADEPFFLWIHYWDPHEPNLPIEPYASMFTDLEELDPLMEERRIDASAFPGRESDRHLLMMLFPRLLKALERGEEVEVPAVTRRSLQVLLNRYDATVRFTDACVGELLDRLEERGLRDEAIVAITGDHGQALGQHGRLGHAEIVNENVLVSLFLRLPPGLVEQPQRIPARVSNIDLMPTILSRLTLPGLEPFLAQSEGEDVLSGSFDRRHVLTARTANPTLRVPDPGRKHAILTEEWKYVRHENGSAELFDLRVDPDTHRNVIEEHAGRAREFERELEEMLRRRRSVGGRGAAAENAEEHLEALRRLGYVDDE
jgi:arylsulfatase A-like enzyme